EAGVEDLPLESGEEEEGEDVHLLVTRASGRLPIAGPQPLRVPRFLDHLERPVGGGEIERTVRRLVEVPEGELVRMRMALGMAVEELAEQGSTGPVDLRDQDQRLVDRHDVLQPRAVESVVLLHPVGGRHRSAVRIAVDADAPWTAPSGSARTVRRLRTLETACRGAA